MIENITIIGAGAWGTALATVARKNTAAVTLLARRADITDDINQNRENSRYLPGVTLADGINASMDPSHIKQADAIIIATPTQHIRDTLTRLRPHWPDAIPVVIAAKGIEQHSGMLVQQIVTDIIPSCPTAILSGPSFAIEVGKGLPTAITLACTDKKASLDLTEALGNPNFRIYQSGDMTGVEIGGAVKNVIAIACGIISGRRLGDNARAALITRGLAEITRLARSLGGRAETLMGLSGLGDLLLTCTAMQSRNYSLGVELGQGKALDDILSQRITVAEGLFTAKSVTELARKHGVDMPICQSVMDILYDNADIDDRIGYLLSRPTGPEI